MIEGKFERWRKVLEVNVLKINRAKTEFVEFRLEENRKRKRE